tara:strand:+ start:1170 stop:2138 length:969 start_codon:yes stop_codon:yes gene_type:complete
LDLEELILRYYLKLFSIFLVTILFLFFLYFFYVLNKKIILKNNTLKIAKGDKIEKVIRQTTDNFSEIDILILKFYNKLYNLIFNNFIHFGNFYIEDDLSFIEFLSTISKPSNIINKITIIEGWSKQELKKEFSKYFEDDQDIPFADIIADTYYFDNNIKISSFIENLRAFKTNYINQYKDSVIYKTFSHNEIMIIGSLIEKEGLDYEDKRKISSVIFNRLNKNMRLQIDATVLFAITDGRYDLKRKLLLSDLKIDNEYNTYKFKGLPPKPISYVGKKTIDIIFENYKTDFLFYFYDNSLKRHVFSKNYKEHINKLNEYRNKK